MSANKARGTRHESTIVRALNAFGIGAYRPAQAGKDVGDVNGVSPFTLQAKDWKDWQSAIREGLDGAERQRLHARESYGVAVVKRVRRSVGEAYAVTTLATWARVLARLRRAEALLALHAPADVFAYHARMTADELAAPFPRGTEKPE